ncbi:MAG: DUF1573 domain-containing protein [Planctomycetaceae bacterium]|nr:DUF1573 domain-containing protein [Planctomycetaceae bacterium]
MKSPIYLHPEDDPKLASAPGQDGPVPIPELTCAACEFDFGQMTVGETGEHTFVVTNTGQAAAILHSGATMMVTRVTLSSNVLAPGESVDVSIRWGAGRAANPGFLQGAWLYCEGYSSSQQEFVIRGEVVAAPK